LDGGVRGDAGASAPHARRGTSAGDWRVAMLLLLCAVYRY
jgi:hypothetical protein